MQITTILKTPTCFSTGLLSSGGYETPTSILRDLVGSHAGTVSYISQ